MRIVGIAFVALAAATLSAQSWQFTDPTAFGYLVADVAGGGLLHYGNRGDGVECYAWNGARWTFVPQQGQPLPRNAGAIACDMFGGRCLALAITGFTSPMRTFVGSFAGWREVIASDAPSSRVAAAMTYDNGRGRFVLFGGEPPGYPPQAPLGDTWEFDGSKWMQRRLAVSPPARTSSAMVYDLARGRCVLFGGGSTSQIYQPDPNTQRNDTWEYDGTAWRQINTPVSPPPSWPLMTYDIVAARTVMHRCQNAPTTGQADTWEYNGTTWRPVFTAQSPTDRLWGSMQYDIARNRTVLYGGYEIRSNHWPHRSDVWEYDGTNWQRVRDSIPSAISAELAYDHSNRRTLAFLPAGQIETWAHDGNQWSIVPTNAAPQLYDFPSLVAHDDARQCTWMIGQDQISQATSVWSLAGNVWTHHPTTTVPPWRRDAAMTLDLARRRIVLFGGFGQSALADTWEFDGNDWRQRITPTTPPPRSSAPLTYDLARGRCVLFGGRDHHSGWARNDTWEYDGVDWQHSVSAHAPPARAGHRQVYDRLRGVTILLAGSTTGPLFKQHSDTWEYDGDWREVTASLPQLTRTSSRSWSAIAYDCDTGRTLYFSAMTIAFATAERRTSTSFASHGRGCPGSLGAPQLGTLPGALPMPGSAFPLVLSGLPSSGGVALLVLGTSVLDHQGSPLPIALDALAMPGCDLWTAVDVVLPFTHGGTSHQLSLTVPTAQQLAGAVIGAQVLVLDAASPNGIASVTNGAVICLQ